LFLHEPVDASAGATITNRNIERIRVVQSLDSQQYKLLFEFLCVSTVRFSAEVVLLIAFMTSFSLYFNYT